MKKSLKEQLPERFAERMERLLNDEYPVFLNSYDENIYAGLRMNTLKITPEEYLKMTDQALESVTWCPTGFYYNGSREYSKNPLYHAGLYYIQEPSAMFPAQVLPVEAGDHIRGFLNSIVITEDPNHLAGPFEEYFDKILIDSPCSGEGMFRKEPSMMRAWEKNGPDFFSKLQREIVDCGVRMLKPGGMMVYSTCTFSVEENEGTLKYILDNYPEMHVIPIEQKGEGLMPAHPEWVDGPEEIRYARRLWPHYVKGEGHFTALLRKDGAEDGDRGLSKMRLSDESKGMRELPEEFVQFLKDGDIRLDFDPARLILQGDHLSYLPENAPPLGKLRRMRTG